MDAVPEETHRTRFEPSGRTVDAAAGDTLLEAAARAGLVIDTPCGGGGTCGKCRVRLLPAGEPSAAEARAFSADELAKGWRLACRQTVSRDMTVYIPESSLFGGRHQILTGHDTEDAPEADSEIRQQPVEMTPPSLTDGTPGLVRLERALGCAEPLEASPETLNRLDAALRDGGLRGAAVLRGARRLLDYLPGAAEAPSFGLAVDLGTTTIAGALLDLRDGAERGVASRVNPQTAHGDDVISRISHACTGAAALAELQDAALEAVREIIRELCANAGVAPESIHTAAFSGNTTMEHLICGINPAALGMVPFVPVFGGGVTVAAREWGLPLHREAKARVFPVIGGFVGGDTVAGLLATRLAERPGTTLFIDVGTNGEIVLCHNGELLAASTAAGPAFEGARISCGMRAAAGAIEKVVIGDDLHLGVIGGGEPAGLCGSGLIDLCGQLLKAGLLGPDGRMPAPDTLPPGTPPALAGRFTVSESGEPCLVLHRDGARDVTLTGRDVRELQLAAGAIRAGFTLLLRQAGLTPDQVDSVLLAGGFGSFIRRDNAQRIGLLPAEIPHDRIHYVGNTSLAGAKWAVLSRDAWRHAGELARRVRHVELSNDPDFAMEFAMAMWFPG